MSISSPSSIMAALLPVEVLQLVCSFLDSRSFYAARRVCRWWYYVSLDKLALVKQLNQLPIQPQLYARSASLRHLQQIYAEAAHTLMLGIRVARQENALSAPLANNKVGYLRNVMPARPYNGCKMVAVNSQKVALLNTYFGRADILSEYRLQVSSDYDSEPWDRVIPTSCHRLTLSTDARLLAVAQDRAIQIFSLVNGIRLIAENKNVTNIASHYILGVEFVLDDHLLRVRLSEKGTVLYLGSPSIMRAYARDDIVKHWSGTRGLKHRMLESSLMLISSPTQSGNSLAWVSAVELLRPLHDGYLFAAQRHGGDQSSYYVLGHVKCAPWQGSGPLTANPTSVVELARLESFLSSCDYNVDALQRIGMATWNSMPSAHEHDPKVALGPDGSLMVVAERERNRVRPWVSTQVFAYRLPNQSKLLSILRKKRDGLNGQGATLSTFLNTLEASRNGQILPTGAKEDTSEHAVARIPLCLGSVEGDEPNIKLQMASGKIGREYRISAVTSGATACWSVQHS